MDGMNLPDAEVFHDPRALTMDECPICRGARLTVFDEALVLPGPQRLCQSGVFLGPRGSSVIQVEQPRFSGVPGMTRDYKNLP